MASNRRERLGLTSQAPRRREPDRPSRLRLWLRRSRALRRPAALATIALALVGSLAWAVWAADPAGRAVRLVEGLSEFGRGAGLTVTEVVVEGRRNTPMEFIRSALGVARGDPLLGFSLEGARERLETIAWVSRAHVERHLPGRIVVRLEERQPFAIWQHNNRFVIIDRDGLTVATEGLDQFGPLPLVVGANANRIAAALHDLIVAEPELAERTQALVRINERRWNIRLHNGTDILLPEGAEAAAIERLGELQREARLLDRPLAAIDLRMPDRLVLRTQRQDAPAEPPRGAPPPRRDRG